MKKRYLWIALVLLILIGVASMVGGALVLRTDSPNIPKLYFEGNIANMEKKSDIRNITVRYLDGIEVFSGFAELKVQGTSSLNYEKKNYTINLFSDENHKEKMKVDIGWGEQSKYCLKANWIDKTHARNVVTAKLVSQVQEKYGVLTQAPRNGAVDGFPIEIYSNGEFLGLYTFNIPKDEWQFAMDKDNPDHIVFGGEDWGDPCLFRDDPEFHNWSVEVGEESEDNLAKLGVLVDFVMDSDDEQFRREFQEYMDLDAALNYYIIADFAYLDDNLGKNMLLATYDGKKWYPSLYDLDTSWSAYWNGKGQYDYKDELLNLSKNLLFERIEQCFAPELAERYFELRQDILTEDHIMAEFRNFRAEIPNVVFAKEAVRWGDGVIRIGTDIPGYNYGQIEKYLDSVVGRLDEKYSAMRG